MGRAKEKPLYDPPTDIEDDLYLWSFEQAELLRQRRFSEADLPNIIEELESMARSSRRALISNYTVVLAHLLKWQFQPERRGKSWRVTLVEHRRRIAKSDTDNPSLAKDAPLHILEAYADARVDASVETELPIDHFPAACPYTIAQIRDHDFLPE